MSPTSVPSVSAHAPVSVSEHISPSMSPSVSAARLPVELWAKIVETLHTETSLSLSCVSKFFHSLAIRSLYYDISLDSPSAAASCCRTLATNLNAAAAVRSFSITYTPSEPLKYHYFSSFYQLINTALGRLTHLQSLRLLVLDPSYIHTLSNTRFPSLRHFECYLTLTPALTQFLNRHPSLRYLQIAPTDAPSTDAWPPPPAPPVILPRLEYFVGNSACIAALRCPAPVRSAFLCWDAMDTTPQDAITSLESFSSDSINLLSCRRRGWNLDLLDLVSVWLPNIYVLSITNLLVIDAHPSQTYLDTIKTLLSRFTVLHKLHIHCVDTFRMGDVECRMDDDFATVSGWGAVCPSLVECILPHSNGLKWIRIIDDVFLPDPCDTRGARWIMSTLRGGGFPQWDRVMGEVRKRGPVDRVEGVEGIVDALKGLVVGREWEP